MLDILISNFVTLGMTIGFTFQLLTGSLFEKKVERLFAIGISMILLLVLVDMADHFFALQPSLNNFRYVTSSIGYIVRPAFVVIIISILLRNTTKGLLLWLPIIVLFIIILINPFTHIMFYFDYDNTFHRGPLGLLSHFISGGYLITLLIIVITMYNVIDRKEIYNVVYILCFHATATILESVLGLSFLLTGAMITSTAIYYVYLYVQVYKFDVLTGFLNRRSFYTNMQSLYNTSMVIISIDLNSLKVINDTEGHAAGDKAICTVANILKNTTGKHFHAYRIGGDEFMVVGVNQTKEAADKFIEIAKKELSATKYSASFGYAFYTPEKDFDEVCAEADTKMYKDKELFKQNILINNK